MEQTINIQPALAYIAFAILFCISICWIFKAKNPIEIEAPLPDESEVIGKDLPVGFRFMKDGKVVDVVEPDIKWHVCLECIYFLSASGCRNSPLCQFSKRINKDTVVFKHVK